MKKYLFIILLFVCTSANAATYYVAQTAAGDESGDSYTNRMSVADHNSDTFSVNDIIYLCGAITSQVEPPSSGTSGNEIIYRGDDTGHEVDIDTGNSMTAIDTDGKDYLIFTDIEISGGYAGFGNNATAGTYSEYVYIRSCNIHDCYTRGVQLRYARYWTIGGALSYGNTIQDCGGNDTGHSSISIGSSSTNATISYNHIFGNGTTTGCDGVVIETAATGTIVEYNKIHDHFREDGVDVKTADNVIIRYNDIYGHDQGSGITVQRNSHDVMVYGNRVWDNSLGILLMDNLTGSDTYNIHVFSNLIYKNVNSGINVNASGEDIKGPLYIYNNVIAENAEYGVVSNHYSAGLTINAITEMSYIKNNIFYKNEGYFGTCQQVYIHTNQDDYTTFDNNTYYWPSHSGEDIFRHGDSGGVNLTLAEFQGGTYNQEASGYEEDPDMHDPDNNDYTLDSVVHNGENLGADYDDGIDPLNTTFGDTPPTVAMLDFDDYNNGNWPRGAYAFVKEISISASDTVASEDGPATGSVTISCPNCTGGESVQYALTGTATDTVDYNDDDDGTIAYADLPATVTFTPIADDGCEYPENIIFTLNTPSGCVLGSEYTETIEVADGSEDCGGSPSGNGITGVYQSGAPTWNYQSGGITIGN